MLTPAMPFWGLDPAQADPAWLATGFGLEAILFRGEELDHLDRLDATLQQTAGAGPLTLHFPMSDADYVRDRRTRDQLFAFLELAARHQASGVVLHSNRHVLVEELAACNFRSVRDEFVRFFVDLDQRLTGSGLWVGVENMPLIGDQGDDVDAVFVYPEDFGQFSFRHIGITFDTAHWIGTLESTSTAIDRQVPRALLPPLQEQTLAAAFCLRPMVRHLHLSSVSGVALPPRRSTARAGGVPGETSDAHPYRVLVEGFAEMPRVVVLEVDEADYTARTQIWRALEWLRSLNVVVSQPEP